MTVPAAPVPAADSPDVPGIWRRLAAFLYEGVLLFGVVMISGLLYSALTRQTHALTGRFGLQLFLFVLLGVYFAYFWSRGGQTVAMKAWHIRVVDRSLRPLGMGRAVARYLLSWLWFAPALVALALSPLRSGGFVAAMLIVGVLAYALTARLHPQRQFLHDAMAGTLLITQRPPPRGHNPGR